MFKPYLYRFFHRVTKSSLERGAINIPEDNDLWPESWKKIEYKEYDFKLNESLPSPASTPLIEILKKRKSLNSNSKNEISTNSLSAILYAGYGLTNAIKETRTVPSGGARYPLEVYYISFQGDPEILGAGVYHYNIKKHSLEKLRGGEYSTEKINSMLEYKSMENINGLICITLIFDRTARKYGSRGYRFAHLEAGHVVQNMILAGLEYNIFLRPYMTISEKTIERELNIQQQNEALIYTCLI
jgi:SagB-type dehydrogenase family enzyme